jgi:hypothetical protein
LSSKPGLSIASALAVTARNTFPLLSKVCQKQLVFEGFNGSFNLLFVRLHKCVEQDHDQYWVDVADD